MKMSIDKKYNEWTIIKEVEKKSGMRRVLAKCSCGVEKEVYLKHLKSGASKNCGHNKSIKMREIGKKNLKYTDHNVADTRIYNIWQHMKARCFNKKNPAYTRYGGRGITVCEEWLDFNSFLNWAMKNGYTDDLTIERIDNNYIYKTSNCMWATYKEQANNTRNKKGRRFLTLNGKTMSVKQWSEELNINYATLSTRINKKKWSDEKALTYKKEDKI